MRIFITGGTGLIGRRLVIDRLERGDEVVILSRDAGRAASLFAAEANPNVTVVAGNPAAPGAWQQAVDGCDAVVHLAGAPLADRRWSASYKRQLVNSRVDSTYQVATAIREASQPPRVLISMSGVGYYGDTGDEIVDESARPGEDFVADLARRWEEQAMAAASDRTRIVTLRTGMVLDPRGGALREMLPPFRLFVGGPLGVRRYRVSWIAWRDLIGIIHLAMTDPRATGPMNAVAPQPCTNYALASAIGAALGRPSWLPVPALALRLVVGELANHITQSIRVRPAKALALDYHFVHPEIEPALAALLADGRRSADVRTDAQRSVDSIGCEAVTNGRGDDEPRPAPAIRLVAVAVDGALLRSDGGLSRAVINACRLARQNGGEVVLASARPPRGTAGLVRTLALPGPTINLDGALIWEPVEGRALHHEALDASVAREAIDAVREALPDLPLAVESLDEWVTDRAVDEAAPWVQAAGPPALVGALDDCLRRPVSRLNFIVTPERRPAAIGALRTLWSSKRIALFATSPGVVRVTAPLVDKAVGLQRVARQLNVPREAVMAIGAGDNDLGMIEWAGFGVAMGNATERARVLADWTTLDRDEHGVAHAIHRCVLASRAAAEPARTSAT